MAKPSTTSAEWKGGYPADSKPKKVTLEAIHVMPATKGGAMLEHRMSDGSMQRHVFGKDEGTAMGAHLMKHLKMDAVGKVAEDKTAEEES